jgi:tetratricopeptide (TPR) repeat protein
MPVIERIRIPMTDAGEHERIGHLLVTLADKLPENLEPLEWLVETYARTSDSFQLPAALGRLGDAAAAAGDFARAQKAYGQILEREPENESARHRLEAAQQGKVAVLAEPAPVPVVNLEPPVPEVRARAQNSLTVVDADLDEDTQRFISQSLTDVDLFASYGLTQKAVSVLESVLVRAPRHTGTLEKLLDLHLGSGDDRKTAQLAACLEEIHREKGDAKNADRFSELRRRFQRAAGMDDSEFAVPAAETVPPVIEVSAQSVQANPATEQSVHEVDLSDEWSALSDTLAAPPPEQAPEKVTAETPNVAENAPEKPAEKHSEKSPKPAYVAPAEVRAPAPVEFHLPLATSEPVEQPDSAPNSQAPLAIEEPVAPAPASIESKPVPEFTHQEDYELHLEPAASEKVPHAAPPPSSRPSREPATAMSSEQFLADLASEFHDLDLAPAEPHIATPPPASPEAISTPVADAGPRGVQAGGTLNSSAQLGFAEPLKEVFDEFRAELGEMGKEEDLETHYNLGIAFREMGLLDEAISEFQKVASENDKGRPFHYAMQVCTLLGLAFMDKGKPNIAAVWYERALKTPGLESESVLALRYDLGIAQESAGDHVAALRSFSQVYAMNIDYRDVADRITTLEKSR